MQTVYFVSYYIHNSKNDGWAYKVVNKYTDYTTALKAFHSEFSQYIGGDTYDSVAVKFTDSYGNDVVDPLFWETKFEPEPNE